MNAKTLVSLTTIVICWTAQTVAQVTSPGLTGPQSTQLEAILATTDPGQFAQSATTFWNLRKDWTGEQTNAVRQALGSRAKQWLDDTATLQSLDLDQARALGGFATYDLSDAETSQLAQQIESAFSDAGNTDFGQLEARVTLLGGLVPDDYHERSEGRKFVDDWIERQQLSALTQSQLNSCFRFARPAVRGVSGFHVTWTGYVAPPTSGSYVLSLSPWNINSEFVDYGVDILHRQSMTVDVNGQRVINANQDAWNSESAPIQLTGGEKVPLRVEFAYEHTNENKLCPVILYWRGPGISQGVVPKSVLSNDETGTPGLQATYAWNQAKPDGQAVQVSEQIIDPNIDFVWLDGLTIGAHDPAMQKLAEELVNRWTRPDGDFIGDAARQPQIVSLLSGSQLASCLESLTEHPEQLAGVSSTRMWRFYYAVRCGADEQAIDVLGLWMTQNQNVAADIAPNVSDFYALNRKIYRRFMDYLAFENPQTMQWLEERYLQTEDGRCSLPVAYTLAYSYLALGKIDAWIQSLEDRLAGESLTGENRVNWLLARAMAQEIRRGPAKRNAYGREQLSVSRGWLDEAALVAEAPETKLRIQQERVARLGALNLWEAAEEEIAHTTASTPEDRALVAGWTMNLQAAKSLVATRQEARREAAKRAYVDEIKERRDAAVQRADDRAANRYDELLGALDEGQP